MLLSNISAIIYPVIMRYLYESNIIKNVCFFLFFSFLSTYLYIDFEVKLYSGGRDQETHSTGLTQFESCLPNLVTIFFFLSCRQHCYIAMQKFLAIQPSRRDGFTSSLEHAKYHMRQAIIALSSVHRWDMCCHRGKKICR